MVDVIETVPCSTADALIDELLPMRGRLWEDFRGGGPRPAWIFRGQSDATWGLEPKALRPRAYKDFTAPPALGSSLEGDAATPEQVLELRHVMRFVDLADALGHPIPGDSPTLRDTRLRASPVPTKFAGELNAAVFPPTALLYMFALAQHYGVPTRMLDWTHKPLVASYFAALTTPSDSRDLAVWALNREVVDRELGVESLVGVDGYRNDAVVTFVTPPTAGNPNLAAQAGLFTLVQEPRARTKEDEPEVVRTVDALVRDNGPVFHTKTCPVIYKFTLPCSEVPRLRRVLAELGVHGASVFPGLAGVVGALKEQLLHR